MGGACIQTLALVQATLVLTCFSPASLHDATWLMGAAHSLPSNAPLRGLQLVAARASSYVRHLSTYARPAMTRLPVTCLGHGTERDRRPPLPHVNIVSLVSSYKRRLPFFLGASPDMRNTHPRSHRKRIPNHGPTPVRLSKCPLNAPQAVMPVHEAKMTPNSAAGSRKEQRSRTILYTGKLNFLPWTTL